MGAAFYNNSYCLGRQFLLAQVPRKHDVASCKMLQVLFCFYFEMRHWTKQAQCFVCKCQAKWGDAVHWEKRIGSMAEWSIGETKERKAVVKGENSYDVKLCKKCIKYIYLKALILSESNMIFISRCYILIFWTAIILNFKTKIWLVH